MMRMYKQTALRKETIMSHIDTLLRGKTICACGRAHTCPVDAVHIGSGALQKVAALCMPYRQILMVTDDHLWPICGEKVFAQIQEKAESLVLQSRGHVLVPDEAAIAQIESRLSGETDLIIGVGSGVINDLCKHVSFVRNLPYMIVATAPSMDGYASVGAALILGGMKITLGARPPKAIIADTAILKDAPMDMIQSGWGDIIGKYSCLNDWKLSALIFGEYFCQTVYDLVMDTTLHVERLANGVLAREEAAIAALMEALVIVGVAMSYVGNSRPASGSEHHLSHFFEITGIVHNQPYYPHGTDVLYAAVVTARLREILCKANPERQYFDRAAWERNIRRVYATSAEGVIALQDQLGWYTRDDFEIIRAKWPEIRAVLGEAPSEAAMRAMVRKIGLSTEAFDTFYGSEKISDAIRYAKDLKDRYSVLWLLEKAHAPVLWT